METTDNLALSFSQCEKTGYLREEKLAACPKIIPHGWWWKRFFRSERRKRATMQAIMEKVWLDGGFEITLALAGGDYEALRLAAKNQHK